jgi:hypothetical protein
MRNEQRAHLQHLLRRPPLWPDLHLRGHEPADVRHCAADERAVVVPALKNAYEPTLCIRVCKSARVAREAVEELWWDVAATRQTWVFVPGCGEPAADGK